MKNFDILSDRTGLLLGNAVDISAPIHNLPCHDTNHLPIRKHFLYLRESQRIIFIPVLGNNDTSVDNQKIQIGSDAEISSLPINGTGIVFNIKIVLQVHVAFRTAHPVNLQLSSLRVCG